jgi:hypothetical protein
MPRNVPPQFRQPTTPLDPEKVIKLDEVAGDIKMPPVCDRCDGTGILKPGKGHGYNCGCKIGVKLAQKLVKNRRTRR